MKRRTVLSAMVAAPFVARAQARPRVVVVGGGFGGATAARSLLLGNLEVVLIEARDVYTACPFSNAVIAGMREIEQQRFGYGAIVSDGVRVIRDTAVGVDADRRRLTLESGASLIYDRLILSPGIDMIWDAIPGYDATAADTMPHAWKGEAQTLLLRRQLQAMDNGGTVIMSIPANPYRCPPGPYERAGLIAWYLQRTKPKSKLLVLDAKDTFSKQKLFQAAWKRLYPNTLEWVGLSDGGKIARADPRAGAVETDFQTHRGDVVNIIPPQRAGHIASVAGVADRTGWCPVDPATFESRLVPNIHVIGDAAIMGAMPKSAFAANAQAKVCALAVLRMLNGQAPDDPRLINTCYSLIAPNRAISVSGVYRPLNGLLADIDGAGGTSRLDATDETSALEATYADAWFTTVTTEAFG